MWSRTRSFVRKAWTIILVVSIALWFLMSIPSAGSVEGTIPVESVDDSLFASAAGAVSPLFSPLGFDSWQATGSLMSGLIAKEVVVSTMAQVYGADLPAEDGETGQTTLLEDLGFIVAGFVEATLDTLKSIPLIVGIDLFEDADEEEPSALMEAIQADFERSSGGYAALAGLSFMVFVLLYTPCMVAIAAARHEFGARWMWVSVLGQFAVAWLVAFAVFQGGRLLAG
jgi:ferrous iron transport protein B